MVSKISVLSAHCVGDRTQFIILLNLKSELNFESKPQLKFKTAANLIKKRKDLSEHYPGCELLPVKRTLKYYKKFLF